MHNEHRCVYFNYRGAASQIDYSRGAIFITAHSQSELHNIMIVIISFVKVFESTLIMSNA